MSGYRQTWPGRSNPVENVLSYVMVHGGTDRHDRMLDITWIRDVIEAAKEVVEQADRSRSGDRFHTSIDDLKETLYGSRGARSRPLS